MLVHRFDTNKENCVLFSFRRSYILRANLSMFYSFIEWGHVFMISPGTELKSLKAES